jgi:hypothetical protein
VGTKAVDFLRTDLGQSVLDLAASADAYEQSIGRNFLIEENVGPERGRDFESFDPSSNDIRSLADAYFRDSVQGLTRGHIPSTFDETLNADALLAATVEANQKIVRLERIDAIVGAGGRDFGVFERALAAGDLHVLTALTDEFSLFPGERPAFAAFKSEVDRDLGDPNWLSRIIDRLGLLHHYLYDNGQNYSFALMEYTAADVLAQARRRSIAHCFAVGTVIECRNNPAFFPVPKGSSQGFTVDLQERDPPLPLPREILHIRIDYEWHHVKRLEQWSRADTPDIEAARARHLAVLRKDTGRVDFGDIIA